MTIYKPYTYLIGWSNLGKFYYGVRYAKNCHPDDLWKNYFTSSEVVKEYILKYGDPDIKQIRKTFNNANDAQLWEYKVLKRLNVWNNPKMLNKGTHKLFHKNDGSTNILISVNTKKAMDNDKLRHHLSNKAKMRGISRICCLECNREMDIGNFKRHSDGHIGITAFYINNGTTQKRLSTGDKIPEGWVKGRLLLPDEAFKKISKANTGRKVSDETKIKMSEAAKRRWNS